MRFKVKSLQNYNRNQWCKNTLSHLLTVDKMKGYTKAQNKLDKDYFEP